MALQRRSGNRFQASIWPGFVDAMTGLLLVLMFVLTIFTVVQFVLRDTISGQETQLDELSAEVALLAQALGLEQNRTAALEADVGQLTSDLADSESQASQQAVLIASLTQQRDANAAALDEAQDQITGFEAQVAGLLAQQATAEATILTLRSEAEASARTIDGLQADAAADAEAIAALEADGEGARATIAALQLAQTTLISEQEALNLALAMAREEIDATTETARLAAARADALDALVADLRRQAVDDQAEIQTLQTARDNDAEALSEAEAAQLAEAAAAEALRARLENADAELTAMTMALEEQRRRAENTLTLLAAAEAARAELDMRLAEALLARQQAENDVNRALNEGDDLDARLVAALGLQETTQAQLDAARAQLAAVTEDREQLSVDLAAALAARDGAVGDLEEVRAALEAALAESELSRAQVEERFAAAVLAEQARASELAAAQAAVAAAQSETSTMEERLRAALLAQGALETQVAGLTEGRTETEQERASLEARLSEALATLADARAAQDQQMTETQRQEALLAAANAALSDEQALSAESQRQVALLNEQVRELRNQVGRLQTLLDIQDAEDADSQVQIENLTDQLNTALARVASEERRRRVLEETERRRLEEEAARLEAEAQDLRNYRSEFFGRLRDVVADLDGIRIEGDRFVFSSEVLFQPGRAELSPSGRAEMANVASILRTIANDIPEGIDWIIRVDGHTDNVPLSGTGEYRNNWELSQARALSVVLYMINNEGIDPNRLAANGFGEFQPINPEDTVEARAQNRRIELKLTER
ncbi:MAG: peptidoglycan -binding protein [Flavimaricola sp.]|nr:peptidoglycan -binding protein [Flavimaricola sp.]